MLRVHRWEQQTGKIKTNPEVHRVFFANKGKAILVDATFRNDRETTGCRYETRLGRKNARIEESRGQEILIWKIYRV